MGVVGILSPPLESCSVLPHTIVDGGGVAAGMAACAPHPGQPIRYANPARAVMVWVVTVPASLPVASLMFRMP